MVMEAQEQGTSGYLRSAPAGTCPIPRKQRSLIVRGLYAGFGLLCVGVGFIGLVTPGLPGFVFFIIALWAFQNSSEKLESWLLNNRFVGAQLRDWQENKSMTMKAKVLSIGTIWIAVGYTIYSISKKPPILLPKNWGSLASLEVPKAVPLSLLLITILWLTWYLGSRPTKQAA